MLGVRLARKHFSQSQSSSDTETCVIRFPQYVHLMVDIYHLRIEQIDHLFANISTPHVSSFGENDHFDGKNLGRLLDSDLQTCP